MENAIQLILYLNQGFLMIFFMVRKLNCKKGVRPALLAAAAAWGFLAVLQFLIPVFPIPVSIHRTYIISFDFFIPPEVFSLFILFILGLRCSDNKWYISFFWAFVLLALYASSFAVMKQFFLIRYSDYHAVLTPLISNMLLTVAVLFLLKHKSAKYILTPKTVFPFFILVLIDAINISVLFNKQTYTPGSRDLIIINLVSFAGLILTVLLFDIINSLTLRNREMEQVVENIQQSHEHQTELAAVYNNILATQHDLKKRIALAETMLSENGNDSGKEAIKLIGDTQILNQFITGSVMIDALLNAKSTKMKDNNIRFVYNPYPLTKLPLEETLFSVLLANVLDNAIEGVLRIPVNGQEDSRGEIVLTLGRNWNNFYLKCVNDYDPTQAIFEDGVFTSTKENPELHGIGTRSIRKIVSDAGGWVDFSMDESRFMVDIILPMTAEDDFR